MLSGKPGGGFHKVVCLTSAFFIIIIYYSVSPPTKNRYCKSTSFIAFSSCFASSLYGCADALIRFAIFYATVAADFFEGTPPGRDDLPERMSRVGPNPSLAVAPPLAESTVFLLGATIYNSLIAVSGTPSNFFLSPSKFRFEPPILTPALIDK